MLAGSFVSKTGACIMGPGLIGDNAMTCPGSLADSEDSMASIEAE